MKSLLLAAFIVSVAGCASVGKPKIYDAESLQAVAFVSVVRNGQKGDKVENGFIDALNRIGKDAYSTSSVGSAGAYLEYDDNWKWDVAMYLHSLDVKVVDGPSGRVLATIRYGGLFHGYPSTDGVTRKMVKRLWPDALEIPRTETSARGPVAYPARGKGLSR